MVVLGFVVLEPLVLEPLVPEFVVLEPLVPELVDVVSELMDPERFFDPVLCVLARLLCFFVVVSDVEFEVSLFVAVDPEWLPGVDPLL